MKIGWMIFRPVAALRLTIFCAMALSCAGCSRTPDASIRPDLVVNEQNVVPVTNRLSKTAVPIIKNELLDLRFSWLETLRERREPRRKIEEIRFRRFRYLNGSLQHVIGALHLCGVDVCCEIDRSEEEWYLDSEESPVLLADRLLQIDCENATLPEILNQICDQNARYKWECLKSNVINIFPRHGSKTEFRIGKIDISGPAKGIVFKLGARNREIEKRLPLSIRGDPGSPFSEVQLGDGTIRDLLNEIVAPHPGYTWHQEWIDRPNAVFASGHVWPRYFFRFFDAPLKSGATEVDVVFPELHISSEAVVARDFDYSVDVVSDSTATKVVAKKSKRMVKEPESRIVHERLLD